MTFFWDIGANIGTHACYVGKISGSVIAIEPFPGNAQQARINLELNEVDGDVFEYALGGSRRQADLGVPDTVESAVGVGTFTIQGDNKGGDSIDVEVIPGDELATETNSPLPDVMKIDVEGGELDVLRGFNQGLKNARVILVEVHPRYVNQKEVIELLESAGFTVDILRRRNDEIHLLAKSIDK